MRKIYCKSNIYYKKEFQLETSIITDGVNKYAIKEAITKEATHHLLNMYNSKENLKNFFTEFMFCDVLIEDNKLKFNYIDGISISQKIIQAMKTNDKEMIKDLISFQMRLLETTEENSCKFYLTSNFESYFGSAMNEILDKDAYKSVVFDMTTNNFIITSDNKVVLIDYEWYFDFPVPKDLLKYHVLITLYNKFDILEEMLPLTSLTKELGFNVGLDTLNEMWLHFYNYIFWEGTNNYAKIKENYLQKRSTIEDLRGIIEWHNVNMAKQDSFIELQSERIAELQCGINWHNDDKIKSQQFIEDLRKRITELEQGISWYSDYKNKNQQFIESLQHRINELEKGIKWHEINNAGNMEYIQRADKRINELEKAIEWHNQDKKKQDEFIKSQSDWLKKYEESVIPLLNCEMDKQKGRIEDEITKTNKLREKLFKIENKLVYKIFNRWWKI